MTSGTLPAFRLIKSISEALVMFTMGLADFARSVVRRLPQHWILLLNPGNGQLC